VLQQLLRSWGYNRLEIIYYLKQMEGVLQADLDARAAAAAAGMAAAAAAAGGPAITAAGALSDDYLPACTSGSDSQCASPPSIGTAHTAQAAASPPCRPASGTDLTVKASVEPSSAAKQEVEEPAAAGDGSPSSQGPTPRGAKMTVQYAAVIASIAAGPGSGASTHRSAVASTSGGSLTHNTDRVADRAVGSERKGAIDNKDTSAPRPFSRGASKSQSSGASSTAANIEVRERGLLVWLCCAT